MKNINKLGIRDLDMKAADNTRNEEYAKAICDHNWKEKRVEID